MSFFGVELNSQVNKLMFEIRLQLSRNKYSPNIRTIYRSFASYDQEIRGEIQPHYFEKALNANGIFFKKYQFQVFQKAYGNNGVINWFTFLSHLRQPMGPLRRELVIEIFDSIDVNKKGQTSAQQLMEHFNPNEIESYKQGKKGLQQIKSQFLQLLPLKEGNVTRQEFISFYDDLSINFAHNDIFFRYVSNQWHYTPQKHQAVKQQLIKIATKSLRFKLIEKSQATKDQYLLKKLFSEFDSNGNFYLGPYDVDAMIKTLGIQADPRVSETIHNRIDKNSSGYVQFDEFKKFLFHDPYPY